MRDHEHPYSATERRHFLHGDWIEDAPLVRPRPDGRFWDGIAIGSLLSSVLWIALITTVVIAL